jgi:predicted ATP-dependent protease
VPEQPRESSDSEVEMPDDKEEVDEMLETRDQQQEGTLFSLVFMVLFIVHFTLEVKLEAATGIINILNKSLLTKIYNSPTFNGTLMNLTNEH